MPDPVGQGIACRWEHTRDIHLCNVFPGTGRLLLNRALRDWPLGFKEFPDRIASDGVCANGGVRASAGRPDVSFLIGHRGENREPLLLAVLATIAGQTGVSFECIVVEQDDRMRVGARLPRWVRYVHTPLPTPGMLFCRSWAFNVAAKEARGGILVCHDNDLLVPAAYASEYAFRLGSSVDVANLKRFIFGLTDFTRMLQGLPPRRPARRG